jgi:hypothetical protein
MAAYAVNKAQPSSGAAVVVIGNDQILMRHLVEALTGDGFSVIGLPAVNEERLLRYIDFADFLLWTDISARQLETTVRHLPASHRGVQCIGLRNRAISAVTSPGIMSMFLVASLMRAGIECPHKLYSALEGAAS